VGDRGCRALLCAPGGAAQGTERCSNWGFSVNVTGDGGADQHPAQTHPAGLWVLRGLIALLLQVLVLVWFGGRRLLLRPPTCSAGQEAADLLSESLFSRLLSESEEKQHAQTSHRGPMQGDLKPCSHASSWSRNGPFGPHSPFAPPMAPLSSGSMAAGSGPHSGA